MLLARSSGSTAMLRPVARRLLSTAADVSPTPAAAVQAPSRIRSVFFGFLAGMSTAIGGGYYMMRDEILTSSAALKSNVDAIGEGVNSVADKLERIDLLAAEVARLKKEAAKKQDFEDLVNQVQQEKNELSIALSEHKSHVLRSHQELYAAIETLRAP